MQAVKEWEKFVRYLLEAKKVRVIVTGSSSKLLGKEVSESLSGRHLDIEITPLSFREFLDFRGLKIASRLDFVKERLKISRLFDEYMKWGGFPEVTLSPSFQRKEELLLRYFDDIIMKDVVKRFGIKEIEKLENMANILVSNISAPQSYNKLKERIGASVDTVERFAGYLEMARLFIFLRKFDYSVGKQITSISKVYVSDSGFCKIKGFRFSENYGRLAENAVAVELFRRRTFNPRLEIYYWRDYQQREVDFIVKEGKDVKQMIQATAISDFSEVEDRELESLLKASEELGCRNLLMITKDYEDGKTIDGKKIEFLPLWKWLLA